MSWRASGAFAGLVGEDLYGTAGLLDLFSRRAAEGVSADGQLLVQVTACEHLHRMAPLREAGLAQCLRRHLGTGVEARVQVSHVDRLRVRAELLERHRHL